MPRATPWRASCSPQSRTLTTPYLLQVPHSQKPIFFDQSGKRTTWVRRAVVTLALVLSAVFMLFLTSLGIYAASNPKRFARNLNSHVVRADQVKAAALLRTMQFPKQNNSNLTTIQPGTAVTLGFYAPWEEAGRDSVRSNISKLTHLAPVWFQLSADGMKLDTRDFDLNTNPINQEIIDLAKASNVQIVPVLSNATNGNFSSATVAKFLRNQQAQDQMLDRVLRICRSYHFAGINLDFEELQDADYPLVTQLIEQWGTEFKNQSLSLSIDVQVSLPTKIMAEWSKQVDFLVVMTYDEHDESGEAGPIASLEWYDSQLENALKNVDESKVVVGIGNYAYDWKKGESHAESISYQEAIATAAGYRDAEKPTDVIHFDPNSFNSMFEYEDDQNQAHVVWMLDAPSAFNQLVLTQQKHLRGAALWAMGTEDPSIWKLFTPSLTTKKLNATDLKEVRFPFEISFSGKGELLKVITDPQDGARSIGVDAATGMIDEVEYSTYPTAYLIQKSGFIANKLVLTFDDGPDPEWTPKILDILKQQGVPATFFCVGTNIESNPDLAKRIVDEGHEIGSHSFTHPNMGTISELHAEIELNATQRVIESSAGCGTRLFRPPYNADSQPQTASEIQPVAVASRLGYLTVGENIDPNDWSPTITDADGTIRTRTADDIVRLTVDDILHRKATGEEGNVILLHDAGGNREQTVEALPRIIQELKKAGYTFTTVAELAGKNPSDVMPPISVTQRGLVDADTVVFRLSYWFQRLLTWAFILGISLGISRSFVMAILAAVHARRCKNRIFDPTYRPSVEVLIAAYNEEKTVVPTIQSVLDSDYPDLKIYVVNDGSTDQTAEKVQEAFANEPRVILINKENGGKASALNAALSQSHSELVFCIDADTQLEPDAISKLIPNFQNEKVAAIAGNVQVGNVEGAITAWQAVEYRTSQNLDRRALAFLNAITVIPGAIGMWRRSAVNEVGGYSSDTLAEDMDLTWRLRKAGFITETQPAAVAYTEAPETFSALAKQRFRWSYGTLQCLWKHRGMLGRYGFFGWFALPFLWVFQIGFQLLGPLIDLQIIWSLIWVAIPWLTHSSKEITNTFQIRSLQFMLELYALFFLIELISGFVAYRLDRAKPWPLLWLFLQRFAYRQLSYYVMVKSLWHAMHGSRQGWGKLQRTGKMKS